MNFLYDESFTPWETPNLEDKFINYLRQPQEIYLRHPERYTMSITDSVHQSKEIKQSKNLFIDRNNINSRKKLSRNQSKVQLKKSHQSLHFSRDSYKHPSSQTKYDTAINQPFHTLTNFAIKRKSLKEKIEKTKKLLEKNQNLKMTEFRDKAREEKIFEESLQRLLSLNKSHQNLNSSLTLNHLVIDNLLQTKNLIKSHQRGKNSCTELYNKESIKPDAETNKSLDFLQLKTNLMYIKKKASNKTFYRQAKYQKSMNLPKIQILDWERPEI